MTNSYHIPEYIIFYENSIKISDSEKFFIHNNNQKKISTMTWNYAYQRNKLGLCIGIYSLYYHVYTGAQIKVYCPKEFGSKLDFLENGDPNDIWTLSNLTRIYLYTSLISIFVSFEIMNPILCNITFIRILSGLQEFPWVIFLFLFPSI